MSASFSVQEVPSVLWLIHKSRIRWKYPPCPHAAGVYAGEVTVIGIINRFYAEMEREKKKRLLNVVSQLDGNHLSHLSFMLHFHVLIRAQVLDNSVSTMKHTKLDVQR